MNDKVTGLIIREQDFKDSSVILTVLTKEYGKIAFLAQGVRKMSSKNRSHVLPYTKAEFLFDYKETNLMFRMKSAHTLKLYRRLHENLNAALAIPVLAEIIDATLIEGSDPVLSCHFYQLFEDACQALDEGYPADMVLATGISDILESQGIAPDVDECVLDGSTKVAAISVKDGGFLCTECALRHSVMIRSAQELRAFRLIVRARLKDLPVLRQYMDSCLPELDLLIGFLRTHAGIHVRSYELFERMFEEP